VLESCVLTPAQKSLLGRPEASPLTIRKTLVLNLINVEEIGLASSTENASRVGLARSSDNTPCPRDGNRAAKLVIFPTIKGSQFVSLVAAW